MVQRNEPNAGLYNRTLALTFAYHPTMLAVSAAKRRCITATLVTLLYLS